jgi:3-hydroxyisobutyrate dehydrogenase-like beta-hydroxyacid dehydrogenase
MTWQSVGVLSPGEMGAAVATVLRVHGLRTVTCLKGRSACTRQRAEAAQLEVVPTMAQLVRTVEAVLSIVPTMSAPAVGAEIAQAITQVGKPLYFIEANAISPMTSTAIEQTITSVGGRYIDGCIIGGATDVGRSTMCYLSGPDAEVAQRRCAPVGCTRRCWGTGPGRHRPSRWAMPALPRGPRRSCSNSP